MKKWAREHPIKASIAGVIAVPVLAVIIICAVEWKVPNPRALDTNQWAALLGGGLAYAGTCFVGILAVWQNIRFKQENDRAGARAQNINDRLLKLEENRMRPAVCVKCVAVNDSEVILSVENYKLEPILDLKIRNLNYGEKNKMVRIQKLGCSVLKGNARMVTSLKLLGSLSPRNAAGRAARINGEMTAKDSLGFEYKKILDFSVDSPCNVFMDRVDSLSKE